MHNTSFMSMANGLCLGLALLLAIFYIVGLSLLDGAVLASDFSGGDSIESDLIVKGIVNMVIAVGLLFAMGFFVKSTINNRNWWSKVKESLNGGSDDNVVISIVKDATVEIIKIPYGTLMALGMITIFIGLIAVNLSNSPITYTISISNVIFGPIMAFAGYMFYTNEIRSLKRNIFPMIK